MPPAVAALLATLAALLGALAHAWPARASTADASPAWPALSPAPAAPRNSSAPGLRSRSPPTYGGDLARGYRGGNGNLAGRDGVGQSVDLVAHRQKASRR